MKFELLAKFHHGVMNTDSNLDSARPLAILPFYYYYALKSGYLFIAVNKGILLFSCVAFTLLE